MRTRSLSSTSDPGTEAMSFDDVLMWMPLAAFFIWLVAMLRGGRRAAADSAAPSQLEPAVREFPAQDAAVVRPIYLDVGYCFWYFLPAEHDRWHAAPEGQGSVVAELRRWGRRIKKPVRKESRDLRHH